MVIFEGPPYHEVNKGVGIPTDSDVPSNVASFSEPRSSNAIPNVGSQEDLRANMVQVHYIQVDTKKGS